VVAEATTTPAESGETMMRDTLLKRGSPRVAASGAQVSPRSLDLKIPLPFMVSTLKKLSPVPA
jgi:hypothetical protein